MEADVETDLKRNYGEEMRTQVFVYYANEQIFIEVIEIFCF